MRQPINIRLFEIALGLSLGVVLCDNSVIPTPEVEHIYLSLGLIMTCSYLVIFLSKEKLWWLCRIWFFSLWIALGYMHYTNQTPGQFESKKLHTYVIKYRLKSWGKTSRYLAHYQNESEEKSTRVVLLSRDSMLVQNLSTDKTLYTNVRPKAINKAINPGGFDAQSYYSSQGIYYSAELSMDQVYCWDLHPLNLRAKAQKINAHLASYWRQAPISHEAGALALAIILGQTEDLTSDIKTQFAAAGALHVLALSGLHVGMVVLLLQWLLSPIKSLPIGQHIYPILVLGILWGYAFVCGLSPSITRAVCMFSIWQFGQMIQRPISGSNSVLLTYILLIWWAPYWLFSVGFQLSFTAVMALTYIPQQLQNIRRPKNRVYRYFRELSVVGIAAQIGVGPLSIYYFHQFPLLFWLSNLLVLPLMTPLLISGIIISIGSLIAPIPEILWQIWDKLLHLILQSVEWISSHDQWLINGLNMSMQTVLGYYIVAFFIWWGLQHPWLGQSRLLKSYLPLLFCIILFGHISNHWSSKKSKPEFALLHCYKNSVMIVNTPKGYRGLIKDHKQNAQDLINWFNHHRVRMREELALQPIMSFKGSPLIVIDNDGIYPELTEGILVLTNNANIHFETLVNELKPQIILADGSNAKYVVDLWKDRAKQLNQKFLDTYTHGAIETDDPQFKRYF